MPLQGWPWRRLSKSSQNSDIHLETHVRPNRRRLGLPWAPGRHHGARLLPYGLHHLHVQQRPPLACQGPRVKYLPPVCCLGPLNFFSSQDYQDLSHFSHKKHPIIMLSYPIKIFYERFRFLSQSSSSCSRLVSCM